MTMTFVPYTNLASKTPMILARLFRSTSSAEWPELGRESRKSPIRIPELT